MVRPACLALLLVVSTAAAPATSYLRLKSRGDEALIYSPAADTPASGIALVYTHPNGDTFAEPIGAEMARRGHHVLMVNHHGAADSDEDLAPAISSAIAAARALPGIGKVVLVGHSGGGHVVSFYANVAEHGPAACRGAALIYKCRGDQLAALARPDGLVLLDPTLGAFHQMSSIDPANGPQRDPALDMFATANGFDPATSSARYTPAFVARFHTAQAARNAGIVDDALARLAAIDAGTARYADDAPLVIDGIGTQARGARLFQPDVTLLAHTRDAHLLLAADGASLRQPIASVRPPMGAGTSAALRSLAEMNQSTTVRRFLAASAIRTGADFAITADAITGVAWRSAMSSTPGNAQGISVPTLVMVMTCHYLVVPGEIIFENLAARDKSLVGVEGATHLFQPCRPRFGDTARRTFDYLDGWLRHPGRF